MLMDFHAKAKELILKFKEFTDLIHVDCYEEGWQIYDQPLVFANAINISIEYHEFEVALILAGQIVAFTETESHEIFENNKNIVIQLFNQMDRFLDFRISHTNNGLCKNTWAYLFWTGKEWHIKSQDIFEFKIKITFCPICGECLPDLSIEEKSETSNRFDIITQANK